MKKIVLIIATMVLSGICFANDQDALARRSSWTATNDTLVEVSTYMAGGILNSIIIGSNTTSGTIKLYNSKGVATSTIAIISMGGAGANEIPFNVRVSSGLTYTTTNNGANGVTIIYRIMKPVP